MKLLRLLAAALFALLPVAVMAAQFTYVQPVTGPMSMATWAGGVNSTLGAVLSNNSGTTAPAVTGQPGTFQFWVDTSTTPRVLKVYDGTSWLSLGTIDASGHFWGLTGSSLKLAGSSSGTATITPQAAAGTPALSLPTASGTFADGASSPLVLSSTTGNLTCPTCVTSSGGGAATGVAPVAVSAGGAVSITGAAGQVLGGAGPAFTAGPSLGTNASAGGTLGLANGGASGQTVTLQNPSATSAYNFNLPATVGAAGQLLQSAAGGANPMTWWAPTSHAVLVGAAAAAPTAIAAGTNGQILIGQTGADPSFTALSQDCTVTAAGVITCTKTNNVAFAASATTDTTNAANISSGLLAVARGGLGIGSGTSGGVPYYSGSASIASSAVLAANQLVLGGGAGSAPATLGSLGTTTTLLHGNAGGAPTFAAVSLTADVSGILPVANGGDGSSTLGYAAGAFYQANLGGL